MQTPFIQRMVNLEPRDYRIVLDYAIEKGLGRRAFSAALRLIIRDWAEHRASRRHTGPAVDTRSENTSSSESEE